MQSKPNVLVIGLGLIGASFAKALGRAKIAHVLGFDVESDVPNLALEMGIIDECVTDLAKVRQVDVIVMAVPVMAIGQVVTQITALIPELKVLTDVGSVKGEVVRSVQEALGYLPSCFVPGHPIAGAEKSGVVSAKEDLFKNHMHILTPLAESSEEAIALLTELWTACGANVVNMSV